jgi:hypothetical protein
MGHEAPARVRLRPAVWLLACCLLNLPRRARGDINIVVQLQGASVLNPLAISLAQYRSLTQMDNSDLLVTACALGTFSPDNQGICSPCTRCNGTQYALPVCTAVNDALCNSCALCTDREFEYCPCSPALTEQCYIGDRICLPLSPTSLRLTLLMQSNAPLSPAQQMLVQAGIATGYQEWLLKTFGVSDVILEAFTVVDTSRFTAQFLFRELYNATLVDTIRFGTADFYQTGLVYLFGGLQRRRLLSYSRNLVNIVGAFTYCQSNQSCDNNP